MTLLQLDNKDRYLVVVGFDRLSRRIPEVRVGLALGRSLKLNWQKLTCAVALDHEVHPALRCAGYAKILLPNREKCVVAKHWRNNHITDFSPSELKKADRLRLEAPAAAVVAPPTPKRGTTPLHVVVSCAVRNAVRRVVA